MTMGGLSVRVAEVDWSRLEIILKAAVTCTCAVMIYGQMCQSRDGQWVWSELRDWDDCRRGIVNENDNLCLRSVTRSRVQ
jgi:hypothetical protein